MLPYLLSKIKLDNPLFFFKCCFKQYELLCKFLGLGHVIFQICYIIQELMLVVALQLTIPYVHLYEEFIRYNYKNQNKQSFQVLAKTVDMSEQQTNEEQVTEQVTQS